MPRRPLPASGSLSILEQVAIDELDGTPAQLSRLERLLIAAIVEIGRLEADRLADPVDMPGLDRLTRRENDVLQLVLDGHTNKSAGAMLGISARTVEVHRLRLLRKLGLRSSADLIRAMAGTGREAA